MAKTGAEGLRYDPRGWATRENNLIIKKSPPKQRPYCYDSGPTPKAAIQDLVLFIHTRPEVWGIFERLAGG